MGETWLAAMHVALQRDDFVAESVRLNQDNRASWAWTTDSLFRHDLLPQLPAARSSRTWWPSGRTGAGGG